MRWACAISFFASLAWGQKGTIRGELIEKIDLAPGSIVSMRTRDFQVIRCQFEQETAKDPTSLANLRAGDIVELITRFEPGEAVCRLDSLRFLGRPTATPAPGSRPRIGLNLNPLEGILRRGNLQYGGVLTDIQQDRLELRTRTGARYTVLLRDDTHFLGNGLQLSAKDLTLNQRIGIRAGRNVDGALEAFYVMWGPILQPDPAKLETGTDSPPVLKRKP